MKALSASVIVAILFAYDSAMTVHFDKMRYEGSEVIGGMILIALVIWLLCLIVT